MVEKKMVNTQLLFLLVGCSMNMLYNIMLSAVREMGIQRGSQMKN